MDKAVKISIMAGFLIVALSVAYYLVVFLPKKEETRLETQKQEQAAKNIQQEEEKTKILETKKIQCAGDAKKFHNEYIGTVKGYYFEPKYTYNVTLGKCLYSGGYSDQKSHDLSIEASIKLECSDHYDMNKCGYWERFVKDIYTNDDILSTWRGAGDKAIDDYWKKQSELFAQ